MNKAIRIKAEEIAREIIINEVRSEGLDINLLTESELNKTAKKLVSVVSFIRTAAREHLVKTKKIAAPKNRA